MRENESDSEGGGQRQPPEYVNPWAARDQGEAAGSSGSHPSATSPLEPYPQDTVAFGMPPGERGRYPQGSPEQAGYGDQAGYGEGRGAGEAGGFTTSGWGQPGALPPERRGLGGRFLTYLAVAALAASIGAGVTVAVDSHNSAPSPGVYAGDVPGPHDNVAGSGASAPLNQAKVTRKVDPGLVDITSTLKYNSESAEGTGMILSGSGLVITNNHVIDGATSINVRLVGGSRQTYTARVLGYDVTDDVALLKLEGASGLTPESFGNSSQVRLGTTVLALGNAEGRGGATPAPGIINALNRSIQASDEGSGTTEDLNHMLQTDALIQQGDSGGALANNAGQVIGMITAANTSTSSSAGSSGGTLGFAIPINTALSLARQIAGSKSSSTIYIGLPGFLGVEVNGQSSSSSPQQQAADGQQPGGSLPAGYGAGCQPSSQPAGVPAQIAPARKGALVIGVLCGTVAQAKGIVAGDVITTFDGHRITTPSSLTSMTAKYHPGDVVTIDWVGVNGARHAGSITLGTGPAH